MKPMSFYQFYQKMLKEMAAPAPVPGVTPPTPGAPQTPGPQNPTAPGQATAGKPIPGSQPQGQGTSPPVPQTDPKVTSALQTLSQSKDPQIMKMLQGAGIKLPGAVQQPATPQPQVRPVAPQQPQA